MSRYAVSPAFCDAVSQSGLPKYALAARGGLQPVNLNHYLAGRLPLGSIARQRIEAIGLSLGLAPGASCVPSPDPVQPLAEIGRTR